MNQPLYAADQGEMKYMSLVLVNERVSHYYSCFQNGKSHAMYISGVPGTGKTCTTMAVVGDIQATKAFTYVYVNAMEMLNAHQIFVNIYKK